MRSLRRLAIEVFFFLFCSAAIGFSVIMGVTLVSAQELHDLQDPSHFYSSECCNRRDCAPAAPGEVFIYKNGYYVSAAKELIPFGDARLQRVPQKYDRGEFHVCRRMDGSVRCLYVPAGNS